MFGTDEMGGPCFVADFPNLQNHEAAGKKSIDHGRGCLLVPVKHAAREVPNNIRM